MTLPPRRRSRLRRRPALDESFKKPVDPLKLVGTKVHTTTMPLRAQPLTSGAAVGWPSTASPANRRRRGRSWGDVSSARLAGFNRLIPALYA